MKITITSSLIVISLIALASCGSSGTDTTTSAPTISLLTDANSATVESTGSTGIWPSTFTATFSDTIDTTSFTSDNVKMTCDLPEGSTVDQPTITIGEDACVMEACTFSVLNAWRYALLDCTLTFSTGISTNISEGKSAVLEEDATYTFTNACAIDDDFNADSQECWAVDETAGLTWTTWSDILANALTFNPANSTLDYSFASTGDEGFAIYKVINIGSGDYSFVGYITSITDLEDLNAFIITMTDENSTGYALTLTTSEGSRICRTSRIVNGVPIPGEEFEANCTAGEYYMRLKNTDSAITADFSTDGSSWTDIAGGGLSYMDMSGEKALGFYFTIGSTPADTDTLDIEYITVENITASDQY